MWTNEKSESRQLDHREGSARERVAARLAEMWTVVDSANTCLGLAIEGGAGVPFAITHGLSALIHPTSNTQLASSRILRKQSVDTENERDGSMTSCSRITI